jgi:chorismate mutase
MPPSQKSATPVAVGRLARVQQMVLARVRRGVATAAPRPPLEQLQEIRRQIDTLDYELMRLLAGRAALVLQVFAVKQQIGKAVIDLEREQSMLSLRRQWARARGLEADGVAAIFSAVIAFSRGLQGVQH